LICAEPFEMTVTTSNQQAVMKKYSKLPWGAPLRALGLSGVLSLAAALASMASAAAQDLAAPLPATPAASAAPAPVEQTGVSAMESHVVQPGDKLGFSVDQDPTSGAPVQQIVSPFGLLSIPVSRCCESTVTIQAGKKTIKQIQDEIKALLEQEYYRVADVKITLVNPIVKLGQVWFRGAVRTSVIALDPGQPMTLWEALTRAGTTEFANLSKVKVERLDEASGKTETIYVNIDRVNKGNRDEDIILKDGDRVDVKEKWFTIL